MIAYHMPINCILSPEQAVFIDTSFRCHLICSPGIVLSKYYM